MAWSTALGDSAPSSSCARPPTRRWARGASRCSPAASRAPCARPPGADGQAAAGPSPLHAEGKKPSATGRAAARRRRRPAGVFSRIARAAKLQALSMTVLSLPRGAARHIDDEAVWRQDEQRPPRPAGSLIASSRRGLQRGLLRTSQVVRRYYADRRCCPSIRIGGISGFPATSPRWLSAGAGGPLDLILTNPDPLCRTRQSR